jgi:hypothetical protein
VAFPRFVRLVADLGLLLLPVLTVEILTGLILFLFAHGLTPKDSRLAARIFNLLASSRLLFVQDITFQTDAHVWVGYLTVWTVGLKAVASWPTLTGWWPKRFSPSRRVLEKTMAGLVLLLVPVCYATGLVLTVQPYSTVLLSRRTWRDAHLWVSILLLVPLAWHVWRFLPVAIRVATVQLRRIGRGAMVRTIAVRGGGRVDFH